MPVAAQQLPGVDIGGDYEQVGQRFLVGRGAAVQLRREHGAHPLAVHAPAPFGDLAGALVPELLGEEPQDYVAAQLVVAEDHVNRGGHIAGRGGPLGGDRLAGEVPYGVEQRLARAEVPQDRLDADAGPFGDVGEHDLQ